MEKAGCNVPKFQIGPRTVQNSPKTLLDQDQLLLKLQNYEVSPKMIDKKHWKFKLRKKLELRNKSIDSPLKDDRLVKLY